MPAHHQPTEAENPASPKTRRNRLRKPHAAMADAPWDNGDLLAFFKCGTTKLASIKKDPAFPKAVNVCGLQRYDPAAIRAFFLAKQDQAPQP